MKNGYRFAVAWIAQNDNAGNGDSIEEIAGYVSTLLLADLAEKDPDKVARDIMQVRSEHGGTLPTPGGTLARNA